MRLPLKFIGFPSSSTRLLMYAYIASTIFLTLSISTDASSISSMIISYEHRLKVRYSRSITDETAEDEQKESVGARECTEAEKQKKGCLAGSCAALVTSQYHTFILCRCPSDRQGDRCEERAINTDVISATLQQGNLCKEEPDDELVQGYESLFFTNCEKTSSSESAVEDKKGRRAKLKKQREKARKRKLRKRERKRNKKKSLRSSEKSNLVSKEADDIDSLQTSINSLDNLKVLEQELKKKLKTNTKNNIRHASEKSSSHRRRRKLPTTTLIRTTTAASVSTSSLSTQASGMSR
ncbi:uncharacterized protein [Watersipora subatra]|uniref:uncharacterized protein n=1 Tax=Watersipora subatra TaxID=2589382 RepID=UPI00355C55F9